MFTPSRLKRESRTASNLAIRAVSTAKGNSPVFSGLWDYSGMNVFNAKVVGIKDGQFGPWTPGIGAGFVVRTNDKFVSGALNEKETGTLKSYTNGDVYVAVTKTWLHPPVPFLLNLRLEGDECVHLWTWVASPRGSADVSSAGLEFLFRSGIISRLCPRSDSHRSLRRW